MPRKNPVEGAISTRGPTALAAARRSVAAIEATPKMIRPIIRAKVSDPGWWSAGPGESDVALDWAS